MFVQELHITHTDQKMPFINFWLKKGYPLRTFWGCFHWNSFWSKAIECQETPISGCSFKSFTSPILTKNAFHQLLVEKRVPPTHFSRVFSLKFILKQNHWVPRSSHIRMFVQELHITHTDQKCLSSTSGWKRGTPYPLFEGVFIEIHFEAKPLSAKKLPYQDVRSRASHHQFWPQMPFINFWLNKGYPLPTFWGCFQDLSHSFPKTF